MTFSRAQRHFSALDRRRFCKYTVYKKYIPYNYIYAPRGVFMKLSPWWRSSLTNHWCSSNKIKIPLTSIINYFIYLRITSFISFSQRSYDPTLVITTLHHKISQKNIKGSFLKVDATVVYSFVPLFTLMSHISDSLQVSRIRKPKWDRVDLKILNDRNRRELTNCYAIMSTYHIYYKQLGQQTKPHADNFSNYVYIIWYSKSGSLWYS